MAQISKKEADILIDQIIQQLRTQGHNESFIIGYLSSLITISLTETRESFINYIKNLEL